MSTLAHLSLHVISSEGVDWWKDNGLNLLDSEPVFALAAEIKKLQNPKKDEPKEEEEKKPLCTPTM